MISETSAVLLSPILNAALREPGAGRAGFRLGSRRLRVVPCNPVLGWLKPDLGDALGMMLGLPMPLNKPIVGVSPLRGDSSLWPRLSRQRPHATGRPTQR